MRIGIHIVCQLAFSVMLTAVLGSGSVVNPSVANATVYYVATSGNDANPGGQSQPFRTIKKGVSVLKAGDTLYIRQGTYAEALRTSQITIPSGTSWSSPVTIAGYVGETVTMTGDGVIGIDLSSGSGVSYVIFQHLIIDVTGVENAGGAYLGTGVHHIRFIDLEVKNTFSGVGGGPEVANAIGFSGQGTFIEVLQSNIYGFKAYGFYVRGQNWLIDKNKIHDNAGYGIQIYDSGSNSISDNVISNNEVYGNGISYRVSVCGMVLTSGSNNLAYNNIVRRNNGCGIQVDYMRGGSNSQVYNNTIYGNTAEGISLGSDASGSIVNNNIVYSNGGTITNTSNGSSFAANLCNINSTGCTVVGNPLFVNASANDFSLQAGSPAIDAGVVVSAITRDFKGTPRPQGTACDIGAYEYSQGATPLPAPNNLRTVVQ